MTLLDFDDMIAKYVEALTMPITPNENFKKYNIGHEWIDEDKSVRWNIEKISEANKAYENECEHLQAIKKEEIAKIEKDIVDAIVFEITLSYEFTEKQAKILLEKVKSKAENCFDKECMLNTLETYIDLFREVLSAGEPIVLSAKD